MNGFRLVPPARLVLVLGSVAGLLAGMATVALAGSKLAERSVDSTPTVIEAAHLPPLLTAVGEKVDLTYEAFCLMGDEPVDASVCDIDGTVFVRSEIADTYEPLALEAMTTANGKQLVAHVPEAIASAAGGFEYFAVLRAAGASLTLPAGGADAPHRSIRLVNGVNIDLGTHVFGRARAADARVVAAAWGTGPTDVGLEDGRNLPPIGASAFDVDRAGAVYLLDEARHRILQWERRGSPSARIPVAVSGSLADMTVAPDGSVYVLETVPGPTGLPLVRRFDGFGRELERVAIAERTAAQIRMGARGPIVLQQPSNQWMPVVIDGSLANPSEQRRHGSVGRPLRLGGDVVVLRYRNEIRLSLTDRNGTGRSWRVRSESPLGEVQLVEPLGNRLIVVARVYTDEEDEFVVLVLDARGLVSRFSVTSADWAETAPLGRFKLVGSSLYRLGSTSRGAFVDRFDLGVSR